MQLKTKLGLVDIPNDDVLAASRDIMSSADGPSKVAAPSGAFSVAGGSASVTDALQALDMAAAVLAAVVAHREMLPPDLAIHAGQVRRLCIAAERGLREPNADAEPQTRT